MELELYTDLESYADEIEDLYTDEDEYHDAESYFSDPEPEEIEETDVPF